MIEERSRLPEQHDRRLPEHPVISEEAAREIDNFAAEVLRFQSGELSPERFRSFRLAHGVYGQRQPGVQMVRVKIPAGALTGRQIRRLADIAQEFTPTGLAHLTTRQDVQYHYVPMERVPHLLRLLAEVGLSTREACGNSVRNVTACPLTGYIADELFDVRPYALATYEYLVRNPFAQQLARKFKIAFSSCPEDCASTAIHDIGFVGRLVEEGGRPRYGFKVIVGGGLGSTPFTAQTLEEFVPLEDLLVTVRGIVKVFSDLGNRRNKMKARLKFVVHRLGIDAFRLKVREAVAAFTEEEQREADLFRYVPAQDAARVARRLSIRFTNGWSAGGSLAAAFERMRARTDPAPPGTYTGAGLNKGICGALAPPPGADSVFHRWQAASVRRHVDPERAVVTVAVPLGDIEAPRLKALANLVTAYAADEARIAINQNLVLPNVARACLPELYEGLSAHGFAEPSVGTALDVTSCPGADTCGLGITSSKGLARAIRSELLPMANNGAAGALQGVSIKISGCPNSCGQHHVANIGFHGVVKKVDGKQVPAYQLHLGGRIGQGSARIGDALDKIPARAVPKAVAALLALYGQERHDGESFTAFVDRTPRADIETVLGPLVEEAHQLPEETVDWGQEAPFTTEEIGTGECAGAGIDAVVNPFDNCESELLQASLFMERGQWVDALANLNRSQYTLARVFLDKLGKHPESDYETACELRAQIIDRGHLGDGWNELHGRIEQRLRLRTPDAEEVRALHARAIELLEESKRALPFVAARAEGAAELPG